MDYSLHRLQHYTSTAPTHFQNFVLFTNYQFYVDEFCARARALMASGNRDYEMLVEPGNRITRRGESGPAEAGELPRLPQMPAYHLVRGDHSGITLVNIGVGPSNAKTITDHIAVLRPHAWLMLGHCAGLRDSQRLGDYVLAHGYVREDHVLDADLPTWVPVPALAEVQVALEQAVEEVAGLSGWDLKRIMRTGTVATIDNRNWELRDHVELVERFAQSRAIALDMESATIAANGFRFRVPYGTLLCVSDKPLHELKLPGMASAFYRRQVNQHLEIGIRALERLRGMPPNACTPASCAPSWKPPSNSRHGASHIFPVPVDSSAIWGQGIASCYKSAIAAGLPDRIRAAAPLGTASRSGHAEPACRSLWQGSAQALGVGFTSRAGFAGPQWRRGGASARGGFHLTRSRLCRSQWRPRGARKRSGWAHLLCSRVARIPGRRRIPRHFPGSSRSQGTHFGTIGTR